MSPHSELTRLMPQAAPRHSLDVMRGPCSERRCVLYLEGSLRVPLNGALRRNVRALLRRDKRGIVLDLTRVSRIDAAGVGELIRAHNMVTQASGVLQIARPTRWVREILRRVGLFDILSHG